MEVNRERVGAHGGNELADLFDVQSWLTALLDELGRADVSDEQRIRRRLARHGVGAEQLWATNGGALAAHAHGEAELLGGACETAVDLRGARMAAGHGGDDQGCVQRMAEEAR